MSEFSIKPSNQAHEIKMDLVRKIRMLILLILCQHSQREVCSTTHLISTWYPRILNYTEAQIKRVFQEVQLLTFKLENFGQK